MPRSRPTHAFAFVFALLLLGLLLPLPARSQPGDVPAACGFGEKSATGAPACPDGRARNEVAYADISSGGPLTHIFAGVDASTQVAHALDSEDYEFYPTRRVPGDAGTLLVVDGTLYAPHFDNHVTTATRDLGTYTHFTTISQTTVLGAGTAASPYRVVTIVEAGGTGVRVIQTDTYMTDQESYRTDLQVSNSSGAARSIILYRAGDCYLGADDYGYGMVNDQVGAVACTKNSNNVPEGRILQYVPLTGGSSYFEAYYRQLWTWISTKQTFPNTCSCTEYLDNGMGLSWSQTIPAGGQMVWSHLTTFSPLGSLPLTIEKTADFENSTPGAANGYQITVSNPNAADATLTSLSDELPAEFVYIGNSTTGMTTANPTINAQTLTWNGSFPVPAGGTATLHFGVNVSATPGVYTNAARGTATDYVVSPALDTAPVTVSTQVGPIAMGFRPNPDGYSFRNYGGIVQTDFTVDDLIQMFGRPAVCTNATGDCQVRTAAETWRADMVNRMNGGHCDGFTTTSLRFFKNIDEQSTFQGGATSTYALTLANMRRRIAYFWVLQVPRPVASARGAAINKTPTQVLQQLYLSMANGAPDPTSLIIYNEARTSGHSITPYAIEAAGSGVYRVRVYDNNHPNDSGRSVTIDTNNDTWSYDLGGNLGTWTGSANTHSLGAIALSTYAQPPVCPWCAGGLRRNASPPPARVASDVPLVQTALSGSGVALITDSEGRRIGTVNGQFVDEIPDAFANVLPGGLDLPSQPIFYLPSAEPFSVMLSTPVAGDAQLSQYGPGYAIVADGIAVAPGDTQTLLFAADGKGVSLTPGTSQSPDLGLIAETANGSVRLEVRGGEVDAGDTASLRRSDEGGGKLVYSHRSAGLAQYEVYVRRVTADGAQEFTHGNIGIAQGDTHYLLYGAWNGTGAITLQVDKGSNGTIDESRKLNNVAGAPSLIFLPVTADVPYVVPDLPLLNGNFESGRVNWTETSSHGWPIILSTGEIEDLPTHSGSWSAWLGGDDDEVSTIQQTVTVPADRPFLTYYHSIRSVDTCGHDFGAVVLNNGVVVDQYDLCDDTSAPTWVLHAVNLSAYAGQDVTVQIRVETNGSRNSNLFVDDVAFSASGAARLGERPVSFAGNMGRAALPLSRGAAQPAARLLGPAR